MRNPTFLSRRLFLLKAAIVSASVAMVSSSQAGLDFDLHLQHSDSYSYYSELKTNTSGSAMPFGHYFIKSYDNGTTREYEYTTNGFNFSTGGSSGFNNFDNLLHSVTNGSWTLMITNSTLTNVYTFSIAAPSFTSNMLPAVTVTFPTDGSTHVTNHPNFTWQGPTDYPGIIFVQGYDPTFTYFNIYFPYPPAATTTNWDDYSNDLPEGENKFYVQYTNSATAEMPVSIPVETNTLSPLDGWIAGVQLDDYTEITFFVSTTNSPSGEHALIAHYTFDDPDPGPDHIGYDSTGNGNDMNAGGTFSSGSGTASSSEKVGATGNSVEFDAGSYLAYSPTPSSLLSTFAGSFTVSLWIKTTQSFGSEDDFAYNGACIVSADIDGSGNDYIPIAMTDGQAAFNTGDQFSDDTINSVNNTLNDGQWHHVVVTRDQSSGEKSIYIDGSFDKSEFGTTNLLDDPQLITIGAKQNAAISNPGFAGGDNGYEGLLDDLQIYSGVLSESQVAFLFANPGQALSNIVTGTLKDALDTTNLVWTTGGDTNWFFQTGTSHDGVDAAQSGQIGDVQVSWIQTSVAYDGTISFQWKVDSETNSDYLTVYQNDDDYDSISGNSGWQNVEIPVNAGDVLRWEYAKNSFSSNGQDSAWLDEITYTPDNTNVTVDLAVAISVSRNEFGVPVYSASCSFVSVSPSPPVGTNSVIAPTGSPHTEISPGSSGGGSTAYATLDQLIDSLTNGFWSIHINQGHPSERLYQFQVSISGLTTNNLAPATILYPTNGATGVPTNATFQWTGPDGFPLIFAYKQRTDGANAAFESLPGTSTNWTPPVLAVGNNSFSVDYTTNDVPAYAQFTVPLDIDSNPLNGWNTHFALHSSHISYFVVTDAAAALPVTLLNPAYSNNIASFKFLSQSGLSHIVQYKTSLTNTIWIDLTNISGDGSLKQFTVPTTNPLVKFFRVKTQ